MTEKVASRWLIRPLLGVERIAMLPSAFWEALRTEPEPVCDKLGEVHPEQKCAAGPAVSRLLWSPRRGAWRAPRCVPPRRF